MPCSRYLKYCCLSSVSSELGILTCSWSSSKGDSSGSWVEIDWFWSHSCYLCSSDTVYPEWVSSCLRSHWSMGDGNPFICCFLRGLRNSLYFVFEFFLKTWKVEWKALYNLRSLHSFSCSGNNEDSWLWSHAVLLAVVSSHVIKKSWPLIFR